MSKSRQQLVDQFAGIRGNVKEAVEKDQLKTASRNLESFLSSYPSALQNTLSLIIHRISQASQELGVGTITADTYELRRAKSAQALLALLDDIARELKQANHSVQSKNGGNGICKFFLMYDKADTDQVAKLKKHLFLMERQKVISLYDMHETQTGDIDSIRLRNLQNSDFVLALVSFQFNFSMLDFIEQAHELGKTIIPVLLDEADMENSFLQRFMPLPSNGIPVTAWENDDRAYVDIVKGIRKVVKSANY